MNRLIERYRRIRNACAEIPESERRQVHVERDGNICYLSEYLDETVADDVKAECLEELRTQRRIFIARFAEKYRNVDLTETVSMYSIFDLSPYDKLDGLEIDEKQDNFNHLTADLQKAGEYALAERLVQENERIRRELKSFYKELPRCVFQGDENFSNLCVDENRRISGLFDFNMSGTEVIANYLANAAMNFFYTDEIMQSRSADEIYLMLQKHMPKTRSLSVNIIILRRRSFAPIACIQKLPCTPPTGTHPLFRSIWRRNSARRKSFGFCGKSRRRIFAPDCGTKEMR